MLKPYKFNMLRVRRVIRYDNYYPFKTLKITCFMVPFSSGLLEAMRSVKAKRVVLSNIGVPF